MFEIKIGKKEIFWSYLAQFLSIGAGIVTLPFILNKLTAEEIGLNYILVTIGSIIALVDLGFAPQFARNFTYVFSGAQKIEKEGIGETGDKTNYDLLKSLLKTARYLYALLAGIALILLLIIGTPYVYITTNGFSSVNNSLWIWIVYASGIFFQIYYSYYFSMLLGAGHIKEEKYALIGNNILRIAILLTLLYCGFGLISVSIAQLISPFFGRILSHKVFYSDSIKKELSKCSTISREQIFKNLKILWYNAKRTAVMLVGSYAILKLSMFVAGLYMSLEAFASYGLMVQLTGLLGGFSSTVIQISQPKYASLRVNHKYNKLIINFSEAIIISYILFLIGSLIYISFGNQILCIIKSNVLLPNKNILFLYCIVIFLEYNHANFSTLISSNNDIPFAPASILTGIAVCIGSIMVLLYTNWGIIGLVIVQGLCQAAYQNWKWPQYALNDFKISYIHLISLGFYGLKKKLRLLKND